MEDFLRVEIERYLARGMSQDEAADFLLKAQADPELLACLGRALEDQSYLFDAVRALPRRVPRVRRFRFWLSSESRTPVALIAAIAAAAVILVIGIALSGKPRRHDDPAPAPVAIQPEESPESPRPRPPAPRVAPQRTDEPVPPTPAPPLPPPPAPSPAPEAPRTAEPEKPPAPRETRVAAAPPPPVGSIEKTSGDVVPAAPGPLAAGQTVRTGAKGSAVVRLRRTLVDLGERTLVDELSDGRRRLRLAEGTISVDVTPNAQDPVVLSTRHAEVTVLGTKFRLAVTAEATRVEVREGRVRLQRLSDKASVEVKAGQFAVAGPGELAPRPLPIDEVVLLPAHGAAGGGEWRVVLDPETSSGRAFEALKTANRPKPNTTGDSSRVTFTFRADADRDYHVWVRGRTLATEKHIERDAVILEFIQAQVTERPGENKGVAGGGERGLFNGFMHESSYWWIGGDADGKNDETPVVVRFTRPGFQTIRMYAYETPVRIDAIWISATQKSRPDAASAGPAADRK